MTSQVAFKAESKNEGNIELSGTIYTKEGAEITSFETLNDGMGLSLIHIEMCIRDRPHTNLSQFSRFLRWHFSFRKDLFYNQPGSPVSNPVPVSYLFLSVYSLY